jgi:cytochrome P450
VPNSLGQGVQGQLKRRFAAALSRTPTKDEEPQDLLRDLIQLHKEKPEFNETYLRRMAMTNFGAGHDTLCSALTSAIAMIGSHPHVQNRIVEEMASSQGPIAFDNSVPTYTHASIKEAQRLYPVVGMSLSRRVPASGVHLHECYFPPGTTVGCNPIALHRNPEIFGQDADDFNPDRWLDEEAAKLLDRYGLTWGGGGRTCPGRQLAGLILNRVVAALVWEFQVEIRMPPEEELRSYFLAMLTGVRARFLPRRPSLSRSRPFQDEESDGVDGS